MVLAYTRRLPIRIGMAQYNIVYNVTISVKRKLEIYGMSRSHIWIFVFNCIEIKIETETCEFYDMKNPLAKGIRWMRRRRSSSKRKKTHRTFRSPQYKFVTRKKEIKKLSLMWKHWIGMCTVCTEFQHVFLHPAFGIIGIHFILYQHEWIGYLSYGPKTLDHLAVPSVVRAIALKSIGADW